MQVHFSNNKVIDAVRNQRVVVPMKIYSLYHGDSFNALLLLFYLLAKSTNENQKGVVDKLWQLLHHTTWQMHMNKIISTLYNC